MHPTIATRLVGSLLGAAALMPLAVQAQEHLHEGDIEISVVGGKLTVSGNHVFHADGKAVFEGDLGDFSGGPYKTDDPGYDSAAGTFAGGAIINYAALGSLQFWNGTAWSSAVPGNEYIRLDGTFGEDTRWTAAGVTGDLMGLVGQASGAGNIHEHLDMSAARVGGGVPAIGAYLIQLQLTSASYASSDAYYLALNRGLSGEAFEMAVDALAPVPEPQTWALMLAGLTATGLVLRRRTR
jgi:hypothetical protein